MQGKVGAEERLEAGLEEIMIQIIHNGGNTHEKNELLIMATTMFFLMMVMIMI